MSDELDALIWELHCQGFSVRQIGKRLDVDKSKVQRSITRQTEARADEDTDDLDPDDLDDLDLLDDPDALALFDDAEEHWPAEPLTFVGYERQYFERGKAQYPPLPSPSPAAPLAPA